MKKQYLTGFSSIKSRSDIERRKSYTGYDLWCFKTKVSHLLATYGEIYTSTIVSKDDSIDELALTIDSKIYDIVAPQIPIFAEYPDYALLIPYDYDLYNTMWLRDILKSLTYELPVIFTKYGLLMKFDGNEINSDDNIEALEDLYLEQNDKLVQILKDQYADGHMIVDDVTAEKFHIESGKLPDLNFNLGQVLANSVTDIFCRAIYDGSLDVKLSENIVLQHVFLSYFVEKSEASADDLIINPNYSNDESVTAGIKINGYDDLVALSYALNKYNNFINYHDIMVINLFYTSADNAIAASNLIEYDRVSDIFPFVVTRYIDSTRKYRLTLLLPASDAELEGSIIEILQEADKK